MDVPSRFRNLPPWAVVLIALAGVFVALTAASTVLGILFASIAVATEVGSAAAGVIVALVALAVLVVPLVAAYLMLSGGDSPDDRESDPISVLRQRYLDGEIDEETFERRLDVLMDAGSVDRRGERERLRERE